MRNKGCCHGHDKLFGDLLMQAYCKASRGILLLHKLRAIPLSDQLKRITLSPVLHKQLSINNNNGESYVAKNPMLGGACVSALQYEPLRPDHMLRSQCRCLE